MRESNTLKRWMLNSDPDSASTWIYRMMVLGLLSCIALIEVGAERTVAIEIVFSAVFAGFGMALVYLVIQPLLHEIRHYWETDG